MIAPVVTDPRRRRRMRLSFLVGLAAGVLYVATHDSDPAAARLATGGAPPPEPTAPAVLPLFETGAALGALDAAAAPRPAGWALPAAAIDPSKAAAVDGALTQVLDDGTSVTLTLDPFLQKTAEDLLARYRVERGAIVAIRPATGEILALAEVADFAPSFRNVALQAAGPAASIFKLVASAALLEHASLDPDARTCTHGGQSKLTLYNLKPNERLDTKCETFAEALGSSNNVAFARWADTLLTPVQLQAMAERFLFNKRLPFLWPIGVSRARVPTGSRLGFARSAAGFEGSFASPLHLARIGSAIANEGAMMAPYLVARATSPTGATLFEAQPTRLAQPLSAEIARRLQTMSEATMTHGTGRKYFQRQNKPRLAVRSGGKSGSLSARDDEGPTKHYSWFVASAPLERSEITVLALVVQGEQWTVKGAVLARDLLEAHFSRSGRATRSAVPEPQIKGDPLD
ncbi:MAG: penicillin-binding protein [Deltaproteobacteria bacterium]|nr:penicillin-binding protein [Deltaproteobacteria bacterium]